MHEEAARRFWVLDRRYGQGERKPWHRIRNADDRRENAEVVRMMTEAAEQGHVGAQCYLGFMYASGQGVPQNFPEALRWFRKAHAQGIEQAAGAIDQVLQMQRQQQQGAAAAASPPSQPESPASCSSPPPPIPGTRVELHGLKAKPELNGQRGVVEGFDAASGRCKVKLEDGRGPFKLKVENLKRTAMTTTTKKKEKKKGGK